MTITAVIAEYNPFHNGHAYQLAKARELTGADYLVVIMSGDFVQRGAPAILDQHDRAELALLGGADLILQLQLGFTVFDVVVGEVTYQTAGKCGHIVHNRTFVLTDDFTDGIAWMGNLSNLFCTAFCSIAASAKSFRLTGFSNSQDSVCTGDFHGRVISQKRIPAPRFALAGAFQQIAVMTCLLQNPHHLYWCVAVCV